MIGARIPRGLHRFDFQAGAEPALRVDPGATVVIETLDCFSNKVTSPRQVFERESDLVDLIGAYNPISAPIYVNGARPGDSLAVHIDGMELGTQEPYGVTVVTPESASLCGRPTSHLGLAADTRVCRLEDGDVIFPTRSGTLRQRARPMVGVIGTAPASGAVSSLHYGPTHGGNIDCPLITSGTTVHLPVNVPGGLLSLGDLHALMGDGEVTGVAIETHGEVTVTIEVINGPGAGAIRVDTAEEIGSIGCESQHSVDANLGVALEDLLSRLCVDWGMLTVEAYELLGVAARMRINQCVHREAGPGWTSVLVSLPRGMLPGGACWEPSRSPGGEE